MSKKLQFFLGKGGVGKSTLSALKSLRLAANGRSVLLMSLDPAHNLSDIFKTRLSETEKKVTGQLTVLEVDHKKWTKKYLKLAENSIRESYRYLSAINLDKYFTVLKYSPGIEEYALLLAFDELYQKSKEKYEHIVVDMPPTALALRFFSLPGVSLLWLHKLLELRSDIVARKELITKIKLIKKEIETDKITGNLRGQITRYNSLHTIFSDQQLTAVNVVVNPESLSLNESREIMKTLESLKIYPADVYVNKFTANKVSKDLLSHLNKYICHEIPQSEQELTGIASMNSFLQLYGQRFDD